MNDHRYPEPNFGAVGGIEITDDSQQWAIVDEALQQGKIGAELREVIREQFSPLKTHEYTNSRRILYFAIGFEHEIYGGEVNDRDLKYNLEHVVPQSIFDHKPPMKCDLHHCYPCNSKLNSHRQNYKYMDIPDDISKHLGGDGNVNLSEKDSSTRTFEPMEVSKGNVSRAIAYFMTIYPHYMTNLPEVIDVDVMIAWNDLDVVDSAEMFRSDQISRWQGRRNPYIVRPELLRAAFV
jgi:hypothetical protein